MWRVFSCSLIKDFALFYPHSCFLHISVLLCVIPVCVMPFCVIPFFHDNFMRYPFLRDALLRDVCLRFAYLHNACLHDACLRYAYFCDAFLSYGYFQNRLAAIQLWIDAFLLSMILFQLLNIEFCHRYTSIIVSRIYQNHDNNDKSRAFQTIRPCFISHFIQTLSNHIFNF